MWNVDSSRQGQNECFADKLLLAKLAPREVLCKFTRHLHLGFYIIPLGTPGFIVQNIIIYVFVNVYIVT